MLFWKTVPFILYLYGVVPPLPVAVITPLELPQDVGVGTTVTEGPSGFKMVSYLVFIQPSSQARLHLLYKKGQKNYAFLMSILVQRKKMKYSLNFVKNLA